MKKNSHKFHEHLSRSIAKALTFRGIIMIADLIIVFGITQRSDIALGIMIVSNFSSTVIYILHERMWNQIHWGKKHIKKN